MPISRKHPHALASAHLLLVVLTMVLAPVSSLLVTPSLARDLLAAVPSAATRAPNLAQLPLSFVPNAGQFDPRVRFQTSGMGGTISFTPEEIVLALPADGSTPDAPQSSVVHMRFEGAHGNPSITSGTKLPGVMNFMRGQDQRQWRTGVPTFDGLTYGQLYPGIDLRYEGTQGQLKSTYTVAPGADPSAIRWRYAEATDVRLNGLTGGVQVAIPGTSTPIVEFAPVSWQDIGGQRVPVESRYVVGEDGSIGFALGHYDPAHALTIDPVTAYRTFVGGANTDDGFDVAVDASGVYIVGYTFSPDLNEFGNALAGSADVFVAKFDLTLSTLIYGGYIGGTGSDFGYGIAVDNTGSVYLTGTTASTNFPVTPGVVQGAKSGGNDAFAVKLNPAGAGSYSTYLGGNLNDEGRDIAVDGTGQAYIVGTTLSSTPPFVGNAGGSDAFVTRINANATVFEARLRGGTSTDEGNGIALDGAGNFYIVGTTNSGTGIATGGTVQTTLSAGGSDAFVASYSTGGLVLQYATYLGGNNNDDGLSVAIDAEGNACIVGETGSTDLLDAPRDPLVAPFQEARNGTTDGFVIVLSSDGDEVFYNTYLGGSGVDSANAIVVDGLNNVYVTGLTRSADFPVSSAGTLQGTNAGDADAFVVQLDTFAGSSLIYSTYLGGNTNDVGRGIAVLTDATTTPPTKNVFVVGATASTAFPTTVANTPYQATNGGGGSDAFIVRVGVRPPLLNDDTATTLEDTPVTINVLANDDASPATFVTSTLEIVDEPLGPFEPEPTRVGISAAPSIDPDTAGTTVVNPDGTITFTPAPDVNDNFAGYPATFEYTVCDSDGVCGEPATVTINITPVNDAPSFTVGPTVTAAEDAPAQTVIGHTTAITVGPATAFDEAATQIPVFTVVADNPALFSAQPAIAANGALTFTSAPNANGVATLTVTLNDGGGTANGGIDTAEPQTFQIIITPVNDAPVAGAPPTVTVVEAQPFTVTLDILGINDNADTQPPADVATAAPFPPAQSITVVTPPANGTISGLDLLSVSVIYTSNPNPAATTDSFVVQVCDNGTPAPSLCVNQTVNVVITLVNDPPTANPDTYNATEDTVLTVDAATGVLTNDTDPNDPQNLPLTAVLVMGTTSGTLTLNADGSFTYTPNANFYGTDTFTYFAQSTRQSPATEFDDLTSEPTTVTITVTPVPDDPVAVDDAYTTNEDIALTVPVPGVLTNDSDPDCITPTASECVFTAQVQNTPGNGTLTLNADGSFTYTPNLNFSGIDFFTYIAVGGDGATSNTATVTIIVNGVNDPPTVTFPVGIYALDEDGAPLALNGLTIADVDVGSGTVAVTLTAQFGTLTLGNTAGATVTGNGTATVRLRGTLANINTAIASISYAPLPNANGTEQVAVSVSDEGNTPLPAQAGSFRIDVTIRPVNDAPVATNDTVTLLEDVLTRVPVLTNDNDALDTTNPPAQVPGGGLNPASITITVPPTNGTATPNADGTVSYQPNPNFNGLDSFTYIVCDTGVPLPALCSNPTTVTLTVTAVNDPPTATAGPTTVTVAEDSGAYSQPWGTAFSPGPADEIQTLTLTTTNDNNALFSQQPIVTLNGGNGTLAFTPAPNASGTAVVTLVIRDNGGTANGGQDSLTLTFTIVVTPVNDSPTAVDDNLGVGFNSPTTLNVLANDLIAPDANETLSVTSIVTPPQHGTVAITNNGANVLFTPTEGYKGPDSFVYQVCDNGQTNGVAAPLCDTATVTLIIGIFNVHLPIVTRVPEPDLVASFTLSPVPTRPGQETLVTVTVTNTGTLAASNFWVDFYIEPRDVPTGANTPWNENCKLNPCYGIAWFVSQTVEPGQSITLTSTGNSFVRANTIWRGFFIRGTRNLYVVVDSWNRSPGGNTGDPNGAVLEFDETNNVFSQQITLSSGRGAEAEEPMPDLPRLETLAPRSLRPPE